MMESLPVSDVERLVKLVSRAGDPTVDVPISQRKRELIEGLAQQINAEIFYWSTLVHNPTLAGDVVGTRYIDGGWCSDEEQVGFYHTFADPEMAPITARFAKVLSGRHLTFESQKMPVPAEDAQIWLTLLAKLDIGQCLISAYSLGSVGTSFMAFYRRQGNPPFSRRDVAMVHVVASQVEWLHYEGIDVPAKDKVTQLSRREREVMILLLSGNSLKQVARKLRLSEHTIGDYVKQIYKRFNVSSRAELLSHFISGGQH